MVLLTDQRKEVFDAEELPFETVEKDFTVVGVLPRVIATRGNPLYWGSVIPLQEALRFWKRSIGGSTLSNVISTEQGRGRQFEAIDVRVGTIADLEPVRKKVELKGGVTFSVVDQMERVRRILLILEGILFVLGGIASVVAGLGIANVLVMSVLERNPAHRNHQVYRSAGSRCQIDFFGGGRPDWILWRNCGSDSRMGTDKGGTLDTYSLFSPKWL